MTRRKTILLSFVFGLTSILTVQGQTKFEVPRNIQLKTKEDYESMKLQ